MLCSLHKLFTSSSIFFVSDSSEQCLFMFNFAYIFFTVNWINYPFIVLSFTNKPFRQWHIRFSRTAKYRWMGCMWDSVQIYLRIYMNYICLFHFQNRLNNAHSRAFKFHHGFITCSHSSFRLPWKCICRISFYIPPISSFSFIHSFGCFCTYSICKRNNGQTFWSSKEHLSIEIPTDRTNIQR